MSKIKKFWFHNDIFKSVFFDSTSIAVPYSEEFIIRELKLLKPKIKDENILAKLNHLMEEETAHAYVHHHYNNMLRHEGYEFMWFVNFTKMIQGLVFNIFDTKSRLAICAALEHYTACMSLIAVKYKAMEDGVDERMKRLWNWHFYEEIDHRSDMFDIYTWYGGGYIRRVLAITLVTILFFITTIMIRSYMLYIDGKFFNFKIHYNGFKFLWGKRGLHRILISSMFKFLRTDFHPSLIHYGDNIKPLIHRYKIENELAKYFPTA